MTTESEAKEILKRFSESLESFDTIAYKEKPELYNVLRDDGAPSTNDWNLNKVLKNVDERNYVVVKERMKL